MANPRGRPQGYVMSDKSRERISQRKKLTAERLEALLEKVDNIPDMIALERRNAILEAELERRMEEAS